MLFHSLLSSTTGITCENKRMQSQKWSFCIPAFITLNFKRNDPSIIHAIFQNTSIFESVTCWKTPESTLVNFEHRMGSKATLSYILITLILCLLHYRHLMCAELHHSQSRIDHDIKSYWLLILSNIEIPEHKKPWSECIPLWHLKSKEDTGLYIA